MSILYYFKIPAFIPAVKDLMEKRKARKKESEILPPSSETFTIGEVAQRTIRRKEDMFVLNLIHEGIL